MSERRTRCVQCQHVHPRCIEPVEGTGEWMCGYCVLANYQDDPYGDYTKTGIRGTDQLRFVGGPADDVQWIVIEPVLDTYQFATPTSLPAAMVPANRPVHPGYAQYNIRLHRDTGQPVRNPEGELLYDWNTPMTQRQPPGPPETSEELLAALAEFAGYLKDGVLGIYEPSYAMASLLKLLTLTEQRLAKLDQELSDVDRAVIEHEHTEDLLDRIVVLERENNRLWAAFTKHEEVS